MSEHESAKKTICNYHELVAYWAQRLYQEETLGDGLHCIDRMQAHLYFEARKHDKHKELMQASLLLGSAVLVLMTRSARRNQLPAWYTFRKELIDRLNQAAGEIDGNSEKGQENLVF